ncbi:pentapeptide repeat-containing protein [Nonomuraea dietziae]|uniref:pentapeptide repeat-containing protein n=1 Tax=Nonomuraea dietziae TaxID=65515 RepID=UPI0033CBA700
MKPVKLVLLVLSLLVVVGLMLGPGAVWVLENVDGVTQDDGVAPAITLSPTRPPATPPATAATPPANPKELTAKDWASAVAAVRGNMLAIATGLAALFVVRYTARNANTARRTFQLGERGHVTDRYGKAVEQLGSDQAPVRLGGLHALDQLGQDNPSPALRQTIVDVICAYLRMPYTPPPDEPGTAEPAVPRASIGGVSARPGRDAREERHVRVTAQRILTAHLRYQDPPARRWWERRPADAGIRYWSGMSLDLSGATLIDLDLSGCRVYDADFRGAFFNLSDTDVRRMFFTRRDTDFRGAFFTGDVWFDEATFTGDVWFDGATFTGDASFNAVKFRGNALFFRTTFTGLAAFNAVEFENGATFVSAIFDSAVGFVEATFTRGVSFNAAKGLERAWPRGARAAPVADGVLREWPRAWLVEQDADGWQTLRRAEPEVDGGEGDAADPGPAGEGSGST